jgi:hypothetical protein
LIIIATAAALGHATGIFMSAANTAFGFLAQLQVLLPDLLPFAIRCMLYRGAASLGVYMLCLYTESMDHHHLLYSALLSPITSQQSCQS